MKFESELLLKHISHFYIMMENHTEDFKIDDEPKCELSFVEHRHERGQISAGHSLIFK